MTPYRTSELLDGQSAIRHGFFGRPGGASHNSALNISYGVGDDPEAVTENRRRVAEVMDMAPLVILKQVHSSTVITVDDGPLPDGNVEADALVTRRRDILLGVLTADCAPLLFVDPQAGVIGAAHAGWKGAAHGIALGTIEAMVALGASPANMLVAIGPLISGRNYEVGPQFMAEFLALQPGAEAHFHTPPGKREHFDLRGFLFAQLESAGVQGIDRLYECTYANPHLYFSHRYATHQGRKTGRQVAVIGLTQV